MANQIDITIGFRAIGQEQVLNALQTIRNSMSSFATQVGSLAGFALGGGAVATMIALAKSAGTAAERFDELARRIGATFEGGQVLEKLGKDFGGNAQVFATGLDRLNERLARARAGSLEAYAPFRALGLTLREFDGIAAERKLEVLARAIANAQDQNAAFLAFTEILGQKAAPELRAALELLARDGYDHLAERAKAAGQILSDATGQALAHANRDLRDFTDLVTLSVGKLVGSWLRLADAAAVAWGRMQDPATAAQRAVTTESVEHINRQLLGIGSEEERQRLLVEFQHETKNLRAQLQAADMAELDRRTPLSPAERQSGDAVHALLAEYERAIAALNDDAIVGVYLAYNRAEQTAKQTAAAERERAAAQEEASIWLKENQAKIEAQLVPLREALLSDEARLDALRGRLALADREGIAALRRAQSDEESKRISLELDQKRLPLLRDIQALEDSIATKRTRDLAALEARLAEIDREMVRLQSEAARNTLEDALSRNAAALSALEADFLRTDAAKWAERKRLTDEAVAASEAFLRVQQAIRDAATTEEGRRQADANVTAARRELEAALRSAGRSGPDPNSFQDQLGAGLTHIMQDLGTPAENIARLFTGPIRAGVLAVRDGLQQILGTTEFWSQKLGRIGGSIVGSITSAFSDMFAQMIAGQLQSFVLESVFRQQRKAQVSGELALNTANATAASIASFGTAAWIGLAALVAGMAAGMALAGGFAQGGLVRGPGGPESDAILARLSDGEFVLRAAARRRFGEDFLEQLNAGVLDLAALPVGAGGDGQQSVAPAVATTRIEFAGASPTRSETPPPIQIAFVNTRREMREFTQRDGAKYVFDYVTKRTRKL